MLKKSALVLALIAFVLVSKSSRRFTVGPTEDGGFISVLGWKLKPAGKQIPVDTLPMSSVFAPDGKSLLVLNGGYNPPSVSVIELATLKETARVRVKDAWLGLAMRGDSLFVGGGSQHCVYELKYAAGKLTLERSLALPDNNFIGGVTVSGNVLYAASLYRDRVFAINLATSTMAQQFSTGRRPYRLLLDPDGKSLWVSNWADADVTRYSLPDGKLLDTVKTGDHPTDMAWSKDERLYVANGSANTISVIDPLTPSALDGYTRQAMANTPYRDRQLDAKSAFPPIRHVVYIIKENRTYDQVFGDVSEGNGDASLVLFGEKITPKQHKLAKEFVLLDNFYVNADVSADGHNWSMAAIAPDAERKTWQNRYGGRGGPSGTTVIWA